MTGTMSSLPRPSPGAFGFLLSAAEGPPGPRLRPAVRERRRDGAHLLLGEGHRHRGPGLREARPPRRDREVDLRGRPPHDLPARPLPVRARERLAAVPLDLPPLPSLLQLRAGLPALRRGEAGQLRGAPDGRARAGDLREGRPPPAGRLHAPDASCSRRSRASGTSASSRAAPRRRPGAVRRRDPEAGPGDRALRAAGRDVRVPVPHGLGRHALPLLAALRDDRRAGRAARGRRPDGRRGPAATTRSTRPCSRTRCRSRRRRSTPRSRRCPACAAPRRSSAASSTRSSPAASRAWSTGRRTTRRSSPPPCARSSASPAPRSPTTTRSAWSSTRRRTASSARR